MIKTIFLMFEKGDSDDYRCLKKVIHQNNQMDSQNEVPFLSADFTAKFELVLVLTQENAFS